MCEIKNTDKNNLHVATRFIGNKIEIWIIAKNKDFSILDKVYDINSKYVFNSVINYIFVSEEQFVGKETIKFLLTV